MKGNAIFLTAIERDGMPRDDPGPVSAAVTEILHATAGLYERAGFVEPWIGYLAVVEGTFVGTCAFKSVPAPRPHDPSGPMAVEIAYYTLPAFEGRGIATAMARRLIEIAWQSDPTLIVAAQTLPERNASHRVLQKLGFRHVAMAHDPEAGQVWEWQLRMANHRPPLPCSSVATRQEPHGRPSGQRRARDRGGPSLDGGAPHNRTEPLI